VLLLLNLLLQCLHDVVARRDQLSDEDERTAGDPQPDILGLDTMAGLYGKDLPDSSFNVCQHRQLLQKAVVRETSDLKRNDSRNHRCSGSSGSGRPCCRLGRGGRRLRNGGRGGAAGGECGCCRFRYRRQSAPRGQLPSCCGQGGSRVRPPRLLPKPLLCFWQPLLTRRDGALGQRALCPQAWQTRYQQLQQQR